VAIRRNRRGAAIRALEKNELALETRRDRDLCICHDFRIATSDLPVWLTQEVRITQGNVGLDALVRFDGGVLVLCWKPTV
jgi:hypothetical protein